MSDYGYGLWALVAINSAVFILFAVSFFRPIRTPVAQDLHTAA